MLRRTILECVALRETGMGAWIEMSVVTSAFGGRWEESWVALRFAACPIKAESSGAEGRQLLYF